MASRKRTSLSSAPARPRRPAHYTAQDVARFCEVDLSTIHHWVGKERIPFHRTAGNHLRFRRNDVLRFLRAHGYPLPRALTEVRCPISVVGVDVDLDALATRFEVQHHRTGAVALASLYRDDPPDMLVLALDDPTLAGARTIASLTTEPATRWLFLGAVGDDLRCAEASAAGADFTRTDAGPGLAEDVARVLGVAVP